MYRFFLTIADQIKCSVTSQISCRQMKNYIFVLIHLQFWNLFTIKLTENMEVLRHFFVAAAFKSVIEKSHEMFGARLRKLRRQI